MVQRIGWLAGGVLIVATCGGAPEFSPDAGSYTVLEAPVRGAERTIARVDSTFFGARAPLLGRRFITREHGDASPVAIVSHGFWVEELGERPEIIGSGIEVGGVVRTIVGVMPPGIDLPSGVALWIPGPGTGPDEDPGGAVEPVAGSRDEPVRSGGRL